MRMLCDRFAALMAGTFVGMWYSMNFPPLELPDLGGDKDKGKDSKK
ncbi:uncharacterized protein [Drosophila kikkawai]|uniref:Uncharacterized protein LOC108085156 isoform X2 n=1 Tax=Drosophila kikkawai TaxID=30033 RepID=A0A6P4JR75_DROKI|nr:uncharacterized protein LOC108085156 isoform X2 [Drosophila kikkawai]XP_017037179.1 uncharacterized protein LOC108085156 isoform X2 [Drosophila kikkawai]